MRSFIAIELPGEVKVSLSALMERLRRTGARATWVRPEAMHLTLRFLGDIDDDRAASLRALLQERFAGLAAFPLHIHGVGAFPNPRRPTVVWAGVGLTEPLRRVQAAAEAAAQAIGLSPEGKPFRPHLTLARVKEPQQGTLLGPGIEAEHAFDAGEFAAGGATLFSSRLTPQGAIHERIEEYRFT